MSSNTAIRFEPTTVIRRILWGSSQRQVQVADLAAGQPQVAEHDVLDARPHVALAPRRHLHRPAAQQVQHHRDVVHAQAPERVLVLADDAQVLAVAVDVEHVAQLADVDQLAQLDHGGVEAQQVADHQRAPRARPPAPPARAPRPPSRPAASRRTRACRPRARAWPARGGWAPASPPPPPPARRPRAGRPGGRSCAASGNWAARRARRCSSASQHQRSSASGSWAKLRARLGPQ